MPIRTCIACGAKKEAREMLRVAVNEANEAFFDATRRATGRGAHLCRDEKCIEKALSRGALSRSFKKKIIAPATLQEALRSALIAND